MSYRSVVKKLTAMLWPWRVVFVAAPSFTAIVLLLRGLGALQSLELAMLDRFFQLRPIEERDDRITIVGVSERDLQQYGHPIDDNTIAELLETIAAANPRAIGLDIYRDLPVPPPYDQLLEDLRQNPERLETDANGRVPVEPGYQRLTEVFRNNPNIIGIAKVTGGVESVAPPPVLAELGQIGANDLPPEIDGRQRRGFLYLKGEEDGETYLGLGLKLAMLYLDRLGIQPRNSDNGQWVQIQDTIFYPVERNTGSYVRNDAGGYPMLINFRGPVGVFDRVTLDEVLSGQVDRELFADRVVLIGMTAESLKDFFASPYTSFKQDTNKVPGVEIHAHITSHILSAVLNDRPVFRTIPDGLEALLVLVGASFGAIASWQWRYRTLWWRLAIQVCWILLLGSAAYGLFLAGWWIPIVPPVLAQLCAATAIVAYVARSAAEIRQTFSRYLTDEVVETLLETEGGLSMGGERRCITILTSDLRGFTGISERLPPEQVVGILNIYLEAMAEAIVSYQGTIDEFMGDGILVLFGAPTQRDDDPERAVACAIAMQRAMVGVNREMVDRGLPELEMGIGIHTGEVVVGNIGSTKRTKYGIVGSQVNLTYRIEGYTVGGQILITESTKDVLRVPIETDSQQQVSPKGVREPISIFSVTGIGGPYDLRLADERDELHVLDPPIALNYAEIKGKAIGDERHDGRLVALSEKHADLYTERTIAPLTNLQFRLQTGTDLADTEFYAKVMDAETKPNVFRLRMTSVPLDVREYFAQLYTANRSH